VTIKNQDATPDNTIELVAQELQARIGQLTTQYETQLAVLKVHFSKELEEKDRKIAELEGKSNSNKSV
jgi:hypothetical protein